MKKSLSQRRGAKLERKNFFSARHAFFLIEKFSHQESCDSHVLINQKRLISAETMPWTVEGIAWNTCHS